MIRRRAPTLSLFSPRSNSSGQMRSTIPARRACVEMSISNAALPLLSLLLSLLAITAELDSETLFRSALAIRRERATAVPLLLPDLNGMYALLSLGPSQQGQAQPWPHMEAAAGGRRLAGASNRLQSGRQARLGQGDGQAAVPRGEEAGQRSRAAAGGHAWGGGRGRLPPRGPEGAG